MEQITLQVPSLDQRFAIFIDLCSCDFHAVESLTVQLQVNLFFSRQFTHELNLYFHLITCYNNQLFPFCLICKLRER